MKRPWLAVTAVLGSAIVAGLAAVAVNGRKIVRVPDGVGDPPKADADTTGALCAIYSADRSDSAASVGAALVLVGAGSAYITATMGLATPIYRALGSASLLLPLVPWIIASYHSLISGASMMRHSSLRVVEDELIRRAGLGDRAVGIRATEQVLNPERSRWPQRLASVMSYAGVVTVVIAYTIYVALTVPGVGWWLRAVALAGYCLWAGLLASSWVASYRLYAAHASDVRGEPAPRGEP